MLNQISTVSLYLCLSIGLALSALMANAEVNPIEEVANGQVQLSLDAYTELVNQSLHNPKPAPADYAIGNADINVTVIEHGERSSAQVEANVTIEVFEKEWTLIPVLVSGTALTRVTVDGEPVQLVQGPEGLSWSTSQAGTVSMQLHYALDAQRSGAGFVLPVPVPQAAVTSIQVSFPGTGLDLAVVPAADLDTIEYADSTVITTSVPSTAAVMITWREPSEAPYVISRAHYQGFLEADALVWEAAFSVEVFSGERIHLPVMPASITLADLSIDGQAATVLEQEGYFTTLLQGRGAHTVTARFHIPVLKSAGPPSAILPIPRVPVSQFDLRLPGRKELNVSPVANITSDELDNQTHATVYVPVSNEVTFSWVEAVPENLRTEVRANASIYQSLYAEEGVLHGHALVAYEITHGETNQLIMDFPSTVQINRITAVNGGVSDWAVELNSDASNKQVKVFLDREIHGEYVLQIAYEYLTGAATAPIEVPLIHAVGVQRQRGMIALLAGPELMLVPVDENRLSRVGENQLPAFVRDSLSLSVAHTYKYIDPLALLTVKPTVPERQQGKFDAQVDTLISIGEVTLSGSATVIINVKSGALMDLVLQLPNDINLLGVSGPSIRRHETVTRPGIEGQQVRLEFTQQMQGRFKVEVNYERIVAVSVATTDVPTILVVGAEVEHGRIAIEALTAVEVQASQVEQLSSVEINDLPRQLVLKTTNPILLAYKYAQSPFKLALDITHHQEIDVQVATIEQAHYETLFTRDGLAVTTAELMVRNSRRQFLRLDLPLDAEIWSVLVNGQAEKPAQIGGDNQAMLDDRNLAVANSDSTKQVLIKMINSTQGFPVKIVYAAPIEPMGSVGRISSQLLRPDMVVTRTFWDVFLPIGLRYQIPQTNMQLVSNNGLVKPRLYEKDEVVNDLSNLAGNDSKLHITVPTEGVHFGFEKLYANQATENPYFAIRYTSLSTDHMGRWLSLIAVVSIWLGIIAIGSRQSRFPVSCALGLIIFCSALLAGIFGYIGSDKVWPAILALTIGVILCFYWLARYCYQRLWDKL